MTPSERERRIERAAAAISDQFEGGYRGHWCAEWQKDGRCSRCTEVASAALDAADEAVPVVGEALHAEHCRYSRETLGKERERAERAETAARDFAAELRRLAPHDPLRKSPDPSGAAEALARHPSFSGEEGTEG